MAHYPSSLDVLLSLPSASFIELNEEESLLSFKRRFAVALGRLCWPHQIRLSM